MAVNNRTEAITEVNTKIVPTVTNSTHRDLLNNDIINSIVFRKDVIAVETPIGGAVTIDYVDKDTATTTITVNTTVSFTNIENGDVKYLHITKAATNTVSFAGATDTSQRKLYINTEVTVVSYQVFNKNGVITVNSINIENENEAWQTPSYENNHADYTADDYSGLRFRRLANGMLQLAGSVERSSLTAGIIFTLPLGFRPAQTLPVIGIREDETLKSGTVNSSGVVSVFLAATSPAHLDFNVIFPLDLTV